MRQLSLNGGSAKRGEFFTFGNSYRFDGSIRKAVVVWRLLFHANGGAK